MKLVKISFLRTEDISNQLQQILSLWKEKPKMSYNNLLCICTSCRNLIKKYIHLHLALKYEHVLTRIAQMHWGAYLYNTCVYACVCSNAKFQSYQTEFSSRTYLAYMMRPATTFFNGLLPPCGQWLMKIHL